MAELNSIELEVLKRIKPSRDEYELVRSVYNEVKQALKDVSLRWGALVELEGSIAKNTWISGELDVDVFVLFPEELGRTWIADHGIKVLVEALRSRGIEVRLAYAEHPYVRAEVMGVHVDVVPALKVRDAVHAKTTVDRTPFHTRYVNEKLSPELKDHVRLLKKFMKGIGVYGAELKVEGFSGYLCELMVIYYGGFRETLRGATRWRPFKTVIDIEGYYDTGEALRRFRAPLVVIDPVDPKRNAAAAVSLKSMSVFIAASATYLKRPSIDFFEPPLVAPDEENLKAAIRVRGTDLVGVYIKCPQVAPDVLWGEVKSSLNKLRRLLETYGFKVIDCKGISDEQTFVLLLFELETALLPPMEKLRGPPVYVLDYAKAFISAHMRAEEVGPWVEGDRWVVLRPRRYREAAKLLLERLPEVGLSKDLRIKAQEEGFKVLQGEEIVEVLALHGRLDDLVKFLRKRPQWL